MAHSAPLAVLLDEDAAYRASEQFACDRQYWSEHLADRPEPVSLGGHTVAQSNGGFLRHTVYLERSIVRELRAVADRIGASLPQIITTATAIFLHRLSGAADLVLGLPVAARSSAARCVPGMASNVLPLRLAMHPGMTVSEAISETAGQMRRALEHKRCQIADLRRDLGGIVDRRALFGVSVNIMPFDYGFSFAGNRAVAYNLSLGPVDDLSIAVYDRSDGGPLRIDFDANPALHSAVDLADRQQRFLRLLTAVAEPDRAIGSLSILSSVERATILWGWNDTGRTIPSATLPELFAAQVARTPDAIAVVHEDESLSYGELDARANQLAHYLRALGVGPEVVVGLCVERSPAMLVGLLGILKAGGAYLPLDPGYPAERLAFMLADAGAPVLVTQSALVDRLPAHGAYIVRLDADAAAIAAQPTSAPAPALDPHNTAYVIYTSGLHRRAERRCRRPWRHPQSGGSPDRPLRHHVRGPPPAVRLAEFRRGDLGDCDGAGVGCHPRAAGRRTRRRRSGAADPRAARHPCDLAAGAARRFARGPAA